jgi:cytoskeletal protein CcmA (bactofilin family)
MAPKNDQINSVIGEGSIFVGKFYVHGSLQIDGKFEGEIRTEDHLVIGETGKVKTDIVANRVTVGGTLVGNIEAAEEVRLLETGRVLGNVVTPHLVVEGGVVSQGIVTITGGQKKDVRKIILDSYASGPVLPDLKGNKSIESKDETVAPAGRRTRS